MLKSILQATGIYRNGTFDSLRFLLAGVPVLLFMLWRLSSHGVYGADSVLRAIEQDILSEYKEERYREAGLLDTEPDPNRTVSLVALEIDGLEVRFSNTSMSGSLFSWSGNDPIGVRFDYVIVQNGSVKASEKNVYRCTHRQTRTAVWKCDAISYYLRYL